MATYGVGTKVKFVRIVENTPFPFPLVGCKGVIVGLGESPLTYPPTPRWMGEWDCHVDFGWPRPVNCMFAELEPAQPDSEWASQAVRDLLRKVKEPTPLEGETVMGEK
jgi:hypothetical protein